MLLWHCARAMSDGSWHAQPPQAEVFPFLWQYRQAEKTKARAYRKWRLLLREASETELLIGFPDLLRLALGWTHSVWPAFPHE
jgi:hypothetical protein